MKKKYLFYLLIPISLFCLSHCSLAQEDLPRAATKAFKGMELYSWQDGAGVWWFSILSGTNRIKTVEEVLANPFDIQQVKESFCQLAVGEHVAFSNWLLGPSPHRKVAFGPPPEDLIDELKAQAAVCEIDLVFPQE